MPIKNKNKIGTSDLQTPKCQLKVKIFFVSFEQKY